VVPGSGFRVARYVLRGLRLASHHERNDANAKHATRIDDPRAFYILPQTTSLEPNAI
jgi:hypothetical protein